MNRLSSRKTSTSLTRLTSLLIAAGLLACGPKHSATPQDLRRAWAKSLRDDDPDKAWALLSPQAQARVGRQAFNERWKAEAEERRAMLDAHGELEAGAQAPVLAGRTTHPGGKELTWIKIQDRYYVSSGLPTQVSTITPEGTVRAFVSEIRRLSDASLEGLITPELVERFSESWGARADAIEAALERPGSLELSSSYEQAVLRFEGGALVLERTEQGWRVSDLR